MGAIALTDQFSNNLVQRRQRAVYFTVVSHLSFTALWGDGNVDGIFVDIHTNKCAILFHDLPPWFWLCVGFWGYNRFQHNPRLQGWQVFFARFSIPVSRSN
jgi:hypothetical protein